MTLSLQTASNVGGNKTPCPSDGNSELFRWPVRLPLEGLIGVRTIASVSSPHSEFDQIIKRRQKKVNNDY
jgi:hypothetical protein